MKRTAVIGIGGFGHVHISMVQQMEREGLAKLVAAAQPPFPAVEKEIAALREAGVPVYSDWQEMLAGERPEVATVATPVPLHYPMAAGALAAGAHVLLEKPPVPSVEKLDALASLASEKNLRGAIDFQMLSAGTTRDLKQLVVSGEIGRVQRVTGIGLWKRLDSYYQNAPWHGRLQQDGEWALGGVVSNPLGHILNQCLYFASPAAGCAQPVHVDAEMFRAHPGIDNEDAASLRVRTDTGAVVMFYATTCTAVPEGAWVEVQAERACVRWEGDQALSFRWSDGREERKEYGPEENIRYEKMFRNFYRAIRGEEELFCSFAAARAFTAVVTSAFAAAVPIRPIPPEWIERVPTGESVATHIRGIADDVRRAAAAGQLFTEAGVPWAVS